MEEEEKERGIMKDGRASEGRAGRSERMARVACQRETEARRERARGQRREKR